MNPRQLQNDKDLLNYLIWLSEELRSKDMLQFSEEVKQASHFSIGSASEFLYEAQSVLLKILSARPILLTSDQIGDINAVIAQIKSAFDKVGGA